MNLEEDEHICPKCNGNRVVCRKKDDVWIICPFCQGVGKLDWIENVVGKRKMPYHQLQDKMYDMLLQQAERQRIIIETARQNGETRRDVRRDDLRPMRRHWEGPGF